MAASPQAAIAKYNRNVQGKGGLWQTMASNGASKYASELGAFLGMGQAPSLWTQGFSAGVSDANSRSEWERKTQGQGQKWYNNMVAKARAAGGATIAA